MAENKYCGIFHRSMTATVLWIDQYSKDFSFLPLSRRHGDDKPCVLVEDKGNAENYHFLFFANPSPPFHSSSHLALTPYIFFLFLNMYELNTVHFLQLDN